VRKYFSSIFQVNMNSNNIAEIMLTGCGKPEMRRQTIRPLSQVLAAK
jgi:hypothetical protein